MGNQAVFRIHPTIGIARVGNSQEFNLAPESLTGMYDAERGITGGLPIKAGTENDPIQSSDLRDKKGALKKQAARFKIFHYPEAPSTYPSGHGAEVKVGSKVGNAVVKEIIWTVHLANKKSGGYVLENPNLKYSKGVDPDTYVDSDVPYIDGYKHGTNPFVPGEKNVFPPFRNADISGEPRLRKLTIDPGPRAISGTSAAQINFDLNTDASFYEDALGQINTCDYLKSFPAQHFAELYCPSGPIETLGALQTDAGGRLLVLAGPGRAVSWYPQDTRMVSPTDNDGWFDDTADGPVFAQIKLSDGTSVEAEGAWVVSTDPAYAPQILNSVSLWDSIYDIWVRELALVPELFRKKFNPKYQVCFQSDIQPFLVSAMLQEWTTNWPANATSRHKSIGELTTLKDFEYFDFIRTEKDSSSQSKMPLALGDSGQSFLTPTPTQSHLFGVAYKNGETAKPETLGGGELLDKASLMNCLGGRFSPGIDMTFIVQQTDLYKNAWGEVGPFRINAKKIDYSSVLNNTPALSVGYIPCQDNPDGIEPGDTSKYMALPWHADYNSCAVHGAKPYPENPGTLYWSWPAQRPYAVRVADEVQSNYSFDEDSISALTEDASGKLPKGILKSKLLAYLETNAASLLAIGPYSKKQCVDAIPELSDDTSNSQVFKDFMMRRVVTEIASPHRFSVRGNKTSGAFGDQSGIFFDHLDMVKNWSDIGVVIQGKAVDTAEIDPTEQDYFLETVSQLQGTGERDIVAPWPDFPNPERQMFYELQNLDDNLDVLPKARMYVETILANARKYAVGQPAAGFAGTIDPLGKMFPYTKEKLQHRLDDVYVSLAKQEEGYDPATDPLFKNRDDVVERIIQLAPFDLTDGAWLRNINTAGPVDEVRTLLFSIEQDERGDGDIWKNHCNIYLDLCHDAGFYPYPVESLDFAMDPRFVDSSFSVSSFELAISQFTESYFPEIMGMTLQLEWGVLELKNTQKLMDYYGFNSHFYAMHIGIDNATNGHGNRALTAITLYLDKLRSSGGEMAVQQAWERIWTGYVAFQYYGSAANDLVEKLTQSADTKKALHNRMVALVRDKAPYGRYNHDQHQLGAHKINDWFADPEGFLIELQKAGYIIAGDPKNSKFFELLEFKTGPMFRIFTPDEIQLWKDWTTSLAVEKPDPTKPRTPAENMIALITTLKQQQMGNKDHNNIRINGADGVSRSIADWFDEEPVTFMHALANEENGWIKRGFPDQSLLVTQLLQESTSMGAAFSRVIADTGGKIGRQITIEWIESLAPSERTSEHDNGRLWLTSHARIAPGTRPIIPGQGTIH